MIGCTYLLRGEPVTVLVGFNAAHKDLPPCPAWLTWTRPTAKTGPRNVAIRHADGSAEVRLFRGLRKHAPAHPNKET